MTKIKICGLMSEKDALIVNKYKPDYIGFIFVPNKRRTLSIEKAKSISSLISKDILKVGVFMNQPIEDIQKVLNEDIIDLIQLHGQEDEEYILKLKMITSKKIIKAYEDLPSCDYVLFDNPDPGSGKKYNWSESKSNKPTFLAGGINETNIREVLALHPYSVDLSSGVEVDGIKDEDKIKRIIKEVRNYEG